jgi:hypothetical protein
MLIHPIFEGRYRMLLFAQEVPRPSFVSVEARGNQNDDEGSFPRIRLGFLGCPSDPERFASGTALERTHNTQARHIRFGNEARGIICLQPR